MPKTCRKKYEIFWFYLASDGTGITELSRDYCEVEEKSDKGYRVKIK